MFGIDFPVLTLTPFESPDVRLAAALARAGALSVLDLGRDALAARAALAELAADVAEFGVRIPRHDVISAAELPPGVRVIVVPTPAAAARFAGQGRTVLAQVTSVAEALDAEAAGADALIAKGCEAGGRIGDEGTFLLLQRIVAATKLPVWAQGGIGTFTAAAASGIL